MRLLILAAVISMAYGHAACPALWTHFKGYCYKMFPDPLRQADAETTCGQFAPCSGSGLGQLARLDSPEFNNFIRLYASQFTVQNPAGFEVWTSLTDARRENMWTWGDGTAVTTTNWGQGQPDNGRNSGQSPENCATMNSVSGQWSDVNCQSMNRYICQMTAEVERQPFNPWNPRGQPPMTPGMNPNQPGVGFPGTNPGFNPGTNPGFNPGTNPGFNPGTNPGFNPNQPGGPQNPQNPI